MLVWVYTFGFVSIVLGQFCKWTNLVHSGRSTRVFFILKSIYTLCNEKILRLDTTIDAEFIQLM